MRPNGEKACLASRPSSHSSPLQEGYISIQGYHTWGHLPGVSSALRVVCAAVPAVTLASRSDTGVRGDVTVTSKAAEIPLIQLFTRASAGRDLERFALWQKSTKHLAAGCVGEPHHHLVCMTMHDAPGGPKLFQDIADSWRLLFFLNPATTK